MPRISLGTEPVEIVESFKVLGVHFSSNLSWDNHVAAISKKVYQTIGILNKNRFVLPERIKLFLYNSLILPHIRYAHLVWGTTTMKNLNTLFLLQKRVVRIIANVSFLHPTAELFRQYRMIKVKKFYDYHLSRSFCLAVKNNDRYLAGLSKINKKTGSHNTRFSEIWSVPIPHNNYDLQSLSYVLPQLLNKFEAQNIHIALLSKQSLYSLFL